MSKSFRSSGSKVLIAEVQMPYSLDAPITFDIEVHALRAAIVHRENIKNLDSSIWNQPGIYILIGPVGGESTEIYVGKSGGGQQGVRQRLLTHASNPQKNADFPWWRAMIFTRDTTDGFNTAQIGYLEGRVAAELGALPRISLRSNRGDIDKSLSDSKQATLDEFVRSILASLSLSGLPLEEEEGEEEGVAKLHKKTSGKTKQDDHKKGTARQYDVSLADLVEAGYISAGTEIVFPREGKDDVFAKITAQGAILLDGIAYPSPSGAGIKAHNLRSINGWTAWVFNDNRDRSLADIRDEYLKQEARN